MTVWCVTSSPDNIARTAAQQWTVQGFKQRRRQTAARMQPGDPLVYYATGVKAFAAIAEIRSSMFEDHAIIWKSKPGEDYPWRVEIRPLIMLDRVDLWVPAEELLDQLEHVQKWPRASWHLAFQGNLRELPPHDYDIIRTALAQAAAGG